MRSTGKYVYNLHQTLGRYKKYVEAQFRAPIHFRKETLTLEPTNYSKTDTKIFWSCPTLFDFSVFPKVFGRRLSQDARIFPYYLSLS